jgi:hypothetical protein
VEKHYGMTPRLIVLMFLITVVFLIKQEENNMAEYNTRWTLVYEIL